MNDESRRHIALLHSLGFGVVRLSKKPPFGESKAMSQTGL